MTRQRKHRLSSAPRRRTNRAALSAQAVTGWVGLGDGVVVEPPPAAGPPRRAQPGASRREDLHEEWEARVRSDYAYVARDLRRIVWLSAALLAALFGLRYVIEVP